MVKLVNVLQFYLKKKTDKRNIIVRQKNNENSYVVSEMRFIFVASIKKITKSIMK